MWKSNRDREKRIGMASYLGEFMRAAGGKRAPLVVVASLAIGLMFCPIRAYSQGEVTTKCSADCPNIPFDFTVEVDSLLYPGTRTYLFRVDIDIQAIDTAMNNQVYGRVTCYSGGSGGGSFVECDTAGLAGAMGCVYCNTTGYLEVGWCEDVVTFQLDITSKNNNDIGVDCKRLFYRNVRIPPLPEAPNHGPITCEAMFNDPVNAVNGNLVLERTDVVIESDIGLPIVFKRYYNGLEADSTKRWTHNYDYELYESYRWYYFSDPSQVVIGDVVLVEGNGRTVKFLGGGTIGNPSFLAVESNYRLEFDTAGNTYTVTTDDNTRLVMSKYDDLHFVLSEVLDRNGNTLTTDWTGGRLSEISNEYGRSLKLGYLAVNSQMVIGEIDDADDNNLVSYSYLDYGGANERAVLAKVEYADGSWEEYTPSTHAADGDRIAQTETSDGATWHYEYVEGKVMRAYNESGASDSAYIEHDLLYYSTDVEMDGEEIAAYIYTTKAIRNNAPLDTTKYISRQPVSSYRRYLIEVIDSDCGGCATDFTYDYATGQRSSVTYANGRVDRMLYDDRGNMDTLIQNAGMADSTITAFEYHPTYNLVTKITSPSVAKPGQYKEIEFQRDDAGNDTAIVESGWLDANDTYEYRTDFYYNSLGQLVEIDGPRPAIDVLDTVGFVYDATGAYDLQYVKFSNGETYQFGPRDVSPGGYSYMTDGNGVKTEYKFDPRGRIDSMVENSLGSDKKTTVLDFTAKGAISELTLPLGNTYAFHYDDHNWMTYLLNESGDSIAYGYDAMSNISLVRYYDSAQQLRRSESFVFNSKSQLVEHDGYEYRYNAMGWLDTILSPIEGDSTFLEYDPFGRLTNAEAVRQNGAYDTTQYEYDIHGNLIQVTDPDNNVFAFWYDDRGRLTRDSSSVTGVTEYAYDAADNLVSRTDANGVTVEYEYDALNRLVGADYPDNSLDVTYQYDLAVAYGKGRLGSETRSGATIDYRYDAHGRLVKETHALTGASYVTEYSYNKNDGLSSVTHPSVAKYRYYYDAEGRVVKITAQHGGGQIETLADSIAYEPFGGIRHIRYANDYVTDYNYDTLYDLRGISTSPTSPEDVLRRSYSYDARRNVASFYDSVATSNSTNYDYDRQNRLAERTMGDPIDSTKTIGYTYYANGNRKSRLTYGGVTNYNYTGNRLDSLTDLTQQRLVSFAYDYNGNLVSETTETDTTTYEYDQANRLVTVTRNDSTFQQAYNSRSQRQSLTTAGGTNRYLHALNGLLLSEYQSGSWEADYVYLYGRPLARVYAVTDTIVPEEPGEDDSIMMDGGGQTSTIRTDFYVKWYHHDQLGTPQVMTDQNGNIRWQARYYPFGELESETVWLAENNLRFPGQYHDRPTGLYYNQFRHYRPYLGRYLTPDPIGIAGGLNLYGYAGQNPINYVDPLGLYSWGEFGQDLLTPIKMYDPAWWGSTELGVWTADLIPAEIRDPIAHFAIGVGDAGSLGVTRWFRSTQLYGGDTYTDECTRGYIAGELSGDILMVLTTWGTSEFRLAERVFDPLRKSIIKQRLFRWGYGPFGLDGRLATRLHAHFGLGNLKLMEHHLPYQMTNWVKNLWGQYLRHMLW